MSGWCGNCGYRTACRSRTAWASAYPLLFLSPPQQFLTRRTISSSDPAPVLPPQRTASSIPHRQAVLRLHTHGSPGITCASWPIGSPSPRPARLRDDSVTDRWLILQITRYSFPHEFGCTDGLLCRFAPTGTRQCSGADSYRILIVL